MAKSLTEKDVIYGLQYAGQELVQHLSIGTANHKPAWSLEPGGHKVLNATAERVRAQPTIVVSGESKWGEVRYVWREWAA